MGGNNSRSVPSPGGDVNFDHFQILRAIGKGSFGKVCIVEKKDKPGQLYAMKYVNKIECNEKGSLRNILREVNILSKLEHPFLANLWFSFQDEEDLFMICDLLLGGDLRYHIQHNVKFTEESVCLFIAEISLALDYLRNNNIIHRDIKPDNILLDENGHAHVTDFNVATVLENGKLATAMSGTRPYIAPEIYQCAEIQLNLNYNNKKPGYNYAVDWWSLGVSAWEILCCDRPFNINSGTNYSDAIKILKYYKPIPSSEWSKPMIKLLKSLLQYDYNKRLTNINDLKNMEIMKKLNFNQIINKNINAKFIPSKNHLNCDPTFELEEMIIETRPLHKKKKRLAKQRSLKSQDINDDTNYSNSNYSIGLDLIPEYPIYNREREMENKLRELKEKQWEEELNISMDKAETKIGPNDNQIKSTNRLIVSSKRPENSSIDIDFIDASPETSTS